MKQVWSDLKSFVTVAFTITIIVLIVIVAVKENWEIFQIVFTLFSNITTAVFTYFFSKRKENIMQDNIDKNNESEES
ncbi:MAG: hypothetical protein HFJ32_03190 [Clostridia bacterium]|nr:hypothetical protein [Clostridia bacterium]